MHACIHYYAKMMMMMFLMRRILLLSALLLATAACCASSASTGRRDETATGTGTARFGVGVAAFVSPPSSLPPPLIVVSTTRRPFSKHNNNRVAATMTDDNHKPTTEELWSPRSRHWIHDDAVQRLGHNLDQSLQHQPQEQEQNAEPHTPVVTTLHRNKDGTTVVAVEVASAVSEHEAATVQALAKCTREAMAKRIREAIDLPSREAHHSNYDNNNNFISFFEHRSFGEGQGGNDCTYLAPLLQALRPALAAQVVSIVRLAWKAGGWGDDDIVQQHDSSDDGDGSNNNKYPDPRTLGIRTSEHLSYNGWRSLEAHKDIGSIYTVMISIADPLTYDGGAFFIQNSMFESTDIKPKRLSAIVFLSDTTHGVRRITSGCRESFVTELWKNDDPPLGMNRPTLEQWENYLATAPTATATNINNINNEAA
jgi:hypothetical protein